MQHVLGHRSVCRVVGYIGTFAFADGTTSAHTYVVECDGHYYPARHSTVADALADARTKRRIAKRPHPPRLL